MSVRYTRYTSLPDSDDDFSTTSSASSDSSDSDVESDFEVTDEKDSSTRYAIGDFIMARWRGRGQYYVAQIVERNDDWTYDVIYQDGDDDKKLRKQHLRYHSVGPNPSNLRKFEKKTKRPAFVKPAPPPIAIEGIPTWTQYYSSARNTNTLQLIKYPTHALQCEYDVNAQLNDKISLFKGDITAFQVDAIMNAANEFLSAGGGICGVIHSVAGPELEAACEEIGFCKTGSAVITPGFKLHAKHVLHTVGPRGEKPHALHDAYYNTLDLARDNNVKTVGLCCLSTGIYGYPMERAVFVATQAVREWLSTGDNKDNIDRIVFCVFTEEDTWLYRHVLPCVFPVSQVDLDAQIQAAKVKEDTSSVQGDEVPEPEQQVVNEDVEKQEQEGDVSTHVFKLGEEIGVLDNSGMLCAGEIIDLYYEGAEEAAEGDDSVEEGPLCGIKVHYIGYGSEWDEWIQIPDDINRIVLNLDEYYDDDEFTRDNRSMQGKKPIFEWLDPSYDGKIPSFTTSTYSRPEGGATGTTETESIGFSNAKAALLAQLFSAPKLDSITTPSTTTEIRAATSSTTSGSTVPPNPNIPPPPPLPGKIPPPPPFK